MTMTLTATHQSVKLPTTTAILQNATFYTNSQGFTIDPFIVNTGLAAEIILTTPFIFLPEGGRSGATTSTRCYESDDTELYGYVPQTLVDMMASDRHYVSQYSDLASCLPGGPSMLRRETCYPPKIPHSVVYQTPEGGDLSRTTVITVKPPGDNVVGTSTGNGGGGPTAAPINTGGDAEASSGFNTVADGDPVLSRPGGGSPAGGGGQGPPPPQTSLGAIINSMAGGAQGGNGGQGGGGGGQGGSPAALITPPSGGQPIPASLGSTSFISGTPVFVIPSATTVPAADVPAGLGSTTTINGTPFVILQPTTIPLPAGASVFSTTVVNGTPFLFIPGPTSIPVTAAPAGLVGSTTTIDGTPFLVIPSATSVPAFPGQITVIDGSTFDVFSSATTVPVNPNLPLQGSQTVISGTTFVVLTGPTTVPLLPGSLTVIGGTLEDVFSGPTTVQVNSELPLSGSTTVIDGTTFVVLSGATTVPVLTGGVSPSSFVQASGAGRGRVSWIGFLVSLGKGFGGRFR